MLDTGTTQHERNYYQVLLELILCVLVLWMAFFFFFFLNGLYTDKETSRHFSIWGTSLKH